MMYYKKYSIESRIRALETARKKKADQEEIDRKHDEFLAYIQYLIDHPAPNRNIHDFETDD